MSCLAVSELPLSEQIDIELAQAAKLDQQMSELFAAVDLLASLDPPAPLPVAPLYRSPSTGGSSFFNASPAVEAPPSLLPVETAGAGTFLETSP